MQTRIFAALTLATALQLGAPQQGTQPPLKVSEPVMAARLLEHVTPSSPTEPMAKGSQAMVIVDAVIGTDGKVQEVRIVSGFENFRDSATTAVKKWTYKPYLVNGSPVTVQTTVSVLYTSGEMPGPLLVPDGKGGLKGSSKNAIGTSQNQSGPKIVVQPAPKP